GTAQLVLARRDILSPGDSALKIGPQPLTWGRPARVGVP
ncbi:hypothetical protein A2U01_0072249, partial [Trifolium medium]|nr:hypothetical protein [Trifolium medium]